MSPDKPVFDDAAIERGVKAGQAQAYFPTPGVVRAIVEAVLTPPSPEPEILVSDAMLAAGNSAYHRYFGNGSPCLAVYGHVYRAMERVRLKAAAAEPAAQPARQMHRRSGDDAGIAGVIHERTGRTCQRPPITVSGSDYRTHRRAGEGHCAGRLHRRMGDA